MKGKSKFVQPEALEAANKKRLHSQGLPHAANKKSLRSQGLPQPRALETPPSPTHVTPSPTHVTPTHDIPYLGSGDDDVDDYVDDDVDEELNITDKKKPRY